jgi:hypothetical protein
MISCLRRVQMTYEDIVSLLGYAGDTHVTAHEVYLRPAGSDDTEIAVSLAAIEAVELV